MDLPIDCLIDSPESISFITNTLPIGVILDLYNYMKVKTLEVKYMLLWISKLTNNPRESINQPAFLSKIHRHFKTSASKRRDDKKKNFKLTYYFTCGYNHPNITKYRISVLQEEKSPNINTLKLLNERRKKMKDLNEKCKQFVRKVIRKIDKKVLKLKSKNLRRMPRKKIKL